MYVVIDNTENRDPKLIGVARSKLGLRRLLNVAYSLYDEDEYTDIIWYEADVGKAYYPDHTEQEPIVVEDEGTLDAEALFYELDELQRIIKGRDAK